MLFRITPTTVLHDTVQKGCGLESHDPILKFCIITFERIELTQLPARVQIGGPRSSFTIKRRNTGVVAEWVVADFVFA